ncbi:MAG: DUF4173 domain-containing protein [Chloroflexota bacterium]
MKRLNRLLLVALFLGWAFDFLFWKHAPGISFTIYVLLCLAGGLLVLGLDGVRPSWRALLLLLPVFFFAAMSFIRQEPMTLFLAYVLTLLSLGLLAVSYLGGRWLLYSLTDHLYNFLKLVGSMVSLPLVAWVDQRRQVQEEPGGGNPSGWKRVWAVVRGLLIALPVVAVFAALLASADLVFAQRLEEFIELFRLERLPEYIFRGVYILIGAYLLAGVLLHAAQKSRDEKLIAEGKPFVPPFLGFTEAGVVLGAVVALFAAFVVIQVQYFFGGQANIHLDGYTYSEYARRGFGELITVAFFSLLLFLGLSGIVKRTTPSQRWAFSSLGSGMVLLVGVMLVSAFQRLLLYEAAYGFSRLRAYTHVFMIWLGVLLVVVVVLDILRRERAFALAALLASIGFAATLTLVNVDAFIVRQNVARAAAGESLDVAYLATLSTDSVPALVDAFQSPDLPDYTRDAVGAALVCRVETNYSRRDDDWRAFTFSHWSAGRAMEQVAADLAGYQVLDDDYPVQVLTPGSIYYECSGGWMD